MKWRIVGGCIAGAVFVAQVIFVCICAGVSVHQPIYDPYVIYVAVTSSNPFTTAHKVVDSLPDNLPDYFNCYKNNATFLMIVYCIWSVFRVFGATNYWVCMGIVNVILVDVAILLTALIAKNIRGGVRAPPF